MKTFFSGALGLYVILSLFGLSGAGADNFILSVIAALLAARTSDASWAGAIAFSVFVGVWIIIAL